MRLSTKRNGMTMLAAAAGAALLVAATPVGAQTQNNGQPTPVSKQKDPNRIICEKVEETGSRISAKRVCMTAQQWEEKRRADRAYLEDAQQRSIEPTSG